MINGFRGKYYFLSNYFERPFWFDGIRYQNSEAAFHAQKTLDRSIRKKFGPLNAPSAKRYGRSIPLRSDWEKVKVDLMYRIVKEKFMQNPDLLDRLKETGDEELREENSWNDKFWGCVDGVGQNNLGKILMRIRDELR